MNNFVLASRSDPIMPCSPARLAANRRNALKSTGPQTAEGKAASRLNAFRHGMAGAGDLIAPGEDAELIAHRTTAFARELAAPGEVGRLLAHRAALLSVRLEQATNRDFAVVAWNAQDARDQFDADRRRAVAAWTDALEEPGDPRPALDGLATTPEGLDHLLATWLDLRAGVAAGDPTASARAALWLGLAEGPPAPTDPDLLSRVDAEVARLRRLAEWSPDLAAALDDERDRAGLIATFDPSREATLARRYEAAAERGLYRAMRAIAELRRDQAHELPPIPANLGSNLVPPPLSPPSPPRPSSPGEPPRSVPAPAPLGSFGAAVAAAPSILAQSIAGPLEPPLFPAEPRKKRPDLRKLAANRR